MFFVFPLSSTTKDQNGPAMSRKNRITLQHDIQKYIKRMKKQLTMFVVSGEIPKFAHVLGNECRHRGERLSLCPSGNLENSRSKDKVCKLLPPAGESAGVSCFFILFATGIPEPSDRGWQRAHTFVVVSEKTILV